tara:strand:+ start:437 stop:700 length:264 start_codon:yes stop_codon:yes gene_type:complete
MVMSGNSRGVSTTKGGHMVTSEKQVLAVSEAAAMLNAHPNSVRRWAEIGLLPYFRLGLRGDRRFYREDLERLMQSWQEPQLKLAVVS